MPITPGGAIGSYFVPLANLVIPFRAMRDITRVSIGRDADGHVMIWWALVLICLFIPAYAHLFFERVFPIEGDPPLFILIGKIFPLLRWLLLITGISLVIRITRAQADRGEQVKASA